MSDFNSQKSWEGPAPDAWLPWSPDEIAKYLQESGLAWSVVGGWALDLWLGHQSRSHTDIEIAIPSVHLPRFLKHFKNGQLFAIQNGTTRRIHGKSDLAPDAHQIRIAIESTWRLDVFLEPGDSDIWVFRRAPDIRCARAGIVAFTKAGIPFLKPQAVLLFKSKAPTAKDEVDFARFGPLLDSSARHWLREKLIRLSPTHPWIRML